MSIRLNPEGGEGGGTTGEPNPAQSQGTPPPVADPKPDMVSISKADLEGFLADRAAVAEAKQAAIEAEKAKTRREIEAEFKAGNTEKAMARLQEQTATEVKAAKDRETAAVARFRSTLRGREIADAVAGIAGKLNDGAASWLRDAIERSESIVVVEVGDKMEVRTADGRSVADYVAAELAKPANAFMLKPVHGGGSGATENNRGGSPPVEGVKYLDDGRIEAPNYGAALVADAMRKAKAREGQPEATNWLGSVRNN